MFIKQNHIQFYIAYILLLYFVRINRINILKHKSYGRSYWMKSPMFFVVSLL